MSRSRSLSSIVRQYQREEQRRQRKLQEQGAQVAKMEALERARYEVAVYENRIALLLSVHRETPSEWNWSDIGDSDPPEQPTEQCRQLEQATLELETYRPSLADRMLKRADKKRARLTEAIALAEQADAREFQKALAQFKKDHEAWEELTDLARGVLGGERAAYVNVVEMAHAFDDVTELGSEIRVSFPNPNVVTATLSVNAQDAVPAATKSLLKTGRLSVKEMPKSRFYALYQDHVCSCMLRVGRELLALLPVEMVIVHAKAKLLNTRTGHMEDQCIVSAAMPRETMAALNFEQLDPSDSMGNFVHRMSFLKTKGFKKVEQLAANELAET